MASGASESTAAGPLPPDGARKVQALFARVVLEAPGSLFDADAADDLLVALQSHRMLETGAYRWCVADVERVEDDLVVGRLGRLRHQEESKHVFDEGRWAFVERVLGDDTVVYANFAWDTALMVVAFEDPGRPLTPTTFCRRFKQIAEASGHQKIHLDLETETADIMEWLRMRDRVTKVRVHFVRPNPRDQEDQQVLLEPLRETNSTVVEIVFSNPDGDLNRESRYIAAAASLNRDGYGQVTAEGADAGEPRTIATRDRLVRRICRGLADSPREVGEWLKTEIRRLFG